jgi:hypothetical protein
MMPGRRIIIVCPSLLLLLFSSLQQAAGQPFVIDVRKFGIEDGLPYREVLSLLQDSRGYIWLGTKRGLSRYDGYTFQNFNRQTDSIATEAVWGMREDPEGYFWLLPFPPYQDIERWHPGTRTRSSLKGRYPSLDTVPEAAAHDWYFQSDGIAAAIRSGNTCDLAYWDTGTFRQVRPA